MSMYKYLVYDNLIIVNTRQINGTIYPVAIGRGECVSGVGCWQYLQHVIYKLWSLLLTFIDIWSDCFVK